MTQRSENGFTECASGGGESVNRRAFVAAALGGAGLCYAAAAGYPVYRYLAAPVEHAAAAEAVKEVPVKDAAKLALGSAMMLKFGSRPVLLIHHADGAWVALDAKCTHLGCTVQYEADKNRVYCACHGGVYDARSGANVSGPPPKPLKLYVVRPAPEGGVVVSRT